MGERFARAAGGDEARIRVLVAATRLSTRASAVEAMQSDPDIEVVGEASNRGAASELAHRLRPDVLVLEPGMADPAGEAVIGRRRDELPEIPIVAIAVTDDAEGLLRALMAGAWGYAAGEDLCAAVRTVHGGGCFASPDHARQLLRDYEPGGTRSNGLSARAPYTALERRIVERCVCAPSRAEAAAARVRGERAPWWRLRWSRWSAAFRAGGGGAR